MDDKGLEDNKDTELLETSEQTEETVFLDADSHSKETLASAGEREDSDSYRNVLKRLSDASADAAEASGEFGAVFNVRALVGKTLAKKYEIIARIGRGGMGTVFKARDITLDRDVAVKVLNPSLSDDDLSLNRFLREAKLVSRLKHPNAISLYEFGVEGTVPYLVMEYVEGVSLEQLIADEGFLDIVRTNNILQQVCSALLSAHEIGILHRDLKPDNIMVSRRADGAEFIQVLDFGMAKVLGAENERGVKVSSTGVPCGTPHYMSPELITAQDVDLRADIYALGIIAYQMLVGKTPFEDFSTVEILYHQFHTVPLAVTEANPAAKISKGIEKAIAKALEKHPDDRFQSVREFAEELDHFVSEDFIFVAGSQAAKVVESYRPFSPRTRRSRGLMNPLTKFWLSWFLITVVLVGSIWSIARYSYIVAYQANLNLIRVEDAIGYKLKGIRSLAKLEIEGTKEEAFKGAKNSSDTMLRYYVDLGRNLDVRDKLGDSLLHKTVKSGNVRGMQVLLKGRINPSTRNKKGETPLIMAAKNGSTGFVYALIEAGAAIDAKDEAGRTALMFASQKGHLSSMHALLLQGASVNVADDSGKSPLMLATESKNIDVVHFLLDQGALIEQKDRHGRTPLHWAIANDADLETIRLLVDRGAVVDNVARGKVTPLMVAISKGRYKVARLLIQLGANPKHANSLGMTIEEMVALQGAEAYAKVFGSNKL